MNKKVNTYFISDIHLGSDTKDYPSIYRETLLVKWLDEIKNDAAAIYFVGDTFDFWFEYKKVIPKGFTRFLGKICEITDNNIPVYFFKGNHDLWTFGYLENEIGMTVVNEPQILNINNKIFYIAHGDGLGPFDKSYLFLKKFFTNKICQFLFKKTHPDFGIKLAFKWSSNNRKNHKYPKTVEPEKEWLVKYAKTVLEENDNIDYFIFGHRHIPFQYKLKNGCVFTNLGDWLYNFSYAVYDGKELEIKFYQKT